MFLILIENEIVIYKDLDRNPYLYKGVRISFNGNYIVELEGNYYFKNARTKKIRLEYKHYEIFNEEEFNPIHLFLYENNVGIDDYRLYKRKDFLLTNNKKATILNKDVYLNNLYILLKSSVIKTNSNYLFVNGRNTKETTLQEGDHVEYLGFSMYYYNDFLFINNFLIDNKLEIKQIKEDKLKYSKELFNINQRFAEPIVNLSIEELKECDLPKEKDNRSIILQIGPSITMSLAMLSIAIINVYNNKLNGGSYISSLIFIMMPLTMLISGIIWPLINSKNEDSNYYKKYVTVKNNYLKYLNNYLDRQISAIKSYKDRLNEDVFKIDDFTSKLFTYTRTNPAFLKLTIGYYDICNQYIVNLTGDDEIDLKLKEIEETINKIPNVPLFLDLNKIRYLTVVSNTKFKDYYFNLYLLEISYKHHYDDVVIAIYKKITDRPFNLPHMFVNNTRYSISSERQLQEFNTIKTDKQIVLFLYDKPQFKISNPLIKCIYFSDNENDILYDTEAIVRYSSSYGYIINENKLKFNYFNSDYDFNNYFNMIERYQNVNLLPKIYTYKNKNDNYLIKQNYLNKQNSLMADFAYVGDELLSFDLHETKQGPHGLIGGATGSGKSELLVSFILSLCIRYRPDYINIILIDYKGEGIKDSLSSKNGVVPHIIANISNLEGDAFERLIIKIRNECKRRQLLFNELSSITSLSIVNIDDYIENRNSRLENIAHLIIIVDEFAELKKEYPELMKELVSLSRIGRSLGVHLILSTQRPSGVVDDEIWSNSHFKIALKVHSEKDSQDLIKTNEAAYLNKAGEFYLQVDDSIVKAKSIYSKNDISGNERIEVCTLDNCLNIDKKIVVNNPHPIIESNYIVETIINTCSELDIKKTVFDFEKPEPKTIDELSKEYAISNNELILGEIDDYLNGNKDILSVNNKENILIFSTRYQEIDGLINRLLKEKRKLIIISNKKYDNPLIVDSLLYDEKEDINYLLNKLSNYNKEEITLIIEDFSCFVSYEETYQEQVYKLIQRKETISCNLIILSRKSTFNFKLLNSINNRYIVKAFDNQDLLNIYSCQSKYKGDSFFQKEGLLSFVPVKEDTYIQRDKCKDEFINKIPSSLQYSYSKNKLLIGYSKKNREYIYIKDDEKLLITSLSKNIIDYYKNIYINNSNVVVKLYDSKLQTKDYSQVIWIGGNRDKQSIFFDDSRSVLSEDEAIYIKDGQKEIIKVISNE